MRAFALTLDTIASSRSKLEKIASLAAYLHACSDVDLDASARFFTGSPLPPGEQAQAAIGSRTIIAAATAVFGIDADRLRSSYREHGDLSEAVAACYAPAMDLGLFQDELSPSTMLARLREAAAARGKNAGTLRQHIVERLLRACSEPREVAAVVKVLTGELRIGSREGLLVDAVALAFVRPIADVRRAFAANTDAGIVALAAKHDGLADIKPAYGSPIGFMLASPMAFQSEYKEVLEGEWLLEDKFDGIRAQIHVGGESVGIFSRTGGDITASFPELRDAVLRQRLPTCMLDGEIVAMRDRRPLPFRVLQPRLSRKSPTAEMQAEIPVAYIIFDLLAEGEGMLIDEPLQERRTRLAILMEAHASERFVLASTVALPHHDADAINAAFSEARARGNEGLMLKRLDSAYTPGRRGKSWLKLKQELDTLDVVVVGVEWGHGKRAKMLSDYTFAVQGESGLLTIGKAYSGLTDAEIIEYTPWFLERKTGMLSKRTISVTPELVIEIAFDILQPSDINQSGYSLRFPRIVRIRHDKTPQQITTLTEVEAIYKVMLERESGS